VTIKVLVKALDVVEFLSGASSGAGVSEIGRGVGLDKATVFRVLKTLEQTGYVERHDSAGRYRLSARLWAMGMRSGQGRGLVDAVAPELRGLALATGETAYLAIRSGDESIFLDKADSDAAVRIHTPLGARIPLHCGSASKAMLAWQDEACIERVSGALVAVTRYTITDPAKLLLELRRIRRRGYATASEEWREGIAGVAAPIRDHTGAVGAALAVSGPVARMSLSRMRAMVETVIEAAQRITLRLGGTGV
jgi:DNA-binding IclR family transcriptional regulator